MRTGTLGLNLINSPQAGLSTFVVYMYMQVARSLVLEPHKPPIISKLRHGPEERR